MYHTVSPDSESLLSSQEIKVSITVIILYSEDVSHLQNCFSECGCVSMLEGYSTHTSWWEQQVAAWEIQEL